MKIALIGATGYVGSAVLKEALDRNHEVTAIARNVEKIAVQDDKLSLVQLDVRELDQLTQAVKEHDLVISAFNPGWTNPNIYKDCIDGSKAIQEAVKKSGVKRFIYVGGAGSLYIDGNTQLIDTPEFPEQIKAGASAARDYLEIIKKETQLQWTFFSPAVEMAPGGPSERTGTYRLGLENPVFDENGRSRISVEDAAVVLIDEAEAPKHICKRFTAAY